MTFCSIRTPNMATVIGDAATTVDQVVATEIEHLLSSDEYSDDEYEYDSTEELSAQEQWEKSVDTINDMFSQVVFPLVGKVLGRRFSHVIWGRFATWWWSD